MIRAGYHMMVLCNVFDCFNSAVRMSSGQLETQSARWFAQYRRFSNNRYRDYDGGSGTRYRFSPPYQLVLMITLSHDVSVQMLCRWHSTVNIRDKLSAGSYRQVE